MSELSVRPVTTAQEEAAFLRLPWTVYRDDPQWVAPLWKDFVRSFDPHHNVELEHISLQKFVAWRDGKAVGSIIAHINRGYNDYQKVNVGWFGQFEVLDDAEAAHGLLAAAEGWVRERKAEALLGPATFSSNSEWGLLTEGFEFPPMVMMPHGRPYYRGLVESYGGFCQAMEVYAYRFDGEHWGGKRADRLPERLVRSVGLIKARNGFSVRPVDMRHYDNEVKILRSLYNQAWSRNWGFLPFTEAEVEKIAGDLKMIIDPKIAFFLEAHGKTAGLAVPLPNLYEPLKRVNCRPGQPAWLQMVKLLWHWKIARHISSVRVWALAVDEQFRGQGADAVLYYELLRAGLPRGYRDIEMSWILASNAPMNNALKNLGAEVYKRYSIYEKRF